MRLLLLLLIIVPTAEISILILSGKTIGLLPTISLILLTGLLGAFLAKQQGLETIRKAQRELYEGGIPGDALIDGVCILAGGLLLLTPGFVTDIVGFLLLLPQSRSIFKKWLEKIFRSRVYQGNIKIIR